jgi:hypothetical protein
MATLALQNAIKSKGNSLQASLAVSRKKEPFKEYVPLAGHSLQPHQYRSSVAVIPDHVIKITGTDFPEDIEIIDPYEPADVHQPMDIELLEKYNWLYQQCICYACLLGVPPSLIGVVKHRNDTRRILGLARKAAAY